MENSKFKKTSPITLSSSAILKICFLISIFFVLLILLSSPYYYLFICKYKVNNDKATYENIKKDIENIFDKAKVLEEN